VDTDTDRNSAATTLQGEEGLDDMRLGGWDEYAAARDRFFAQLARNGTDEPDQELSRGRWPASAPTCPRTSGPSASW
jgi:hypothetical protein